MTLYANDADIASVFPALAMYATNHFVNQRLSFLMRGGVRADSQGETARGFSPEPIVEM
jgi:hypothetical protein